MRGSSYGYPRHDVPRCTTLLCLPAKAAMAEPAPWPPPEARPSPIWPWSARGTRRASEVFDVRAHELHAPSPYSGSLWMGDVSLSDVLGARLVTYDRDLQPPNGAWDAPIQPKTVYVQYQGIDPVTQLSASVVVPAQLSLDVWADPNFEWTPQVQEEEPEEEEPEVEEDEDRRKLKSSIKGDPILLRAKPAQVPEAHFAALRHEVVSPSSPSSGRRLRVGGLGVSPEDSGTMSSFLRASGKDKYARSRLGEIDHIIAQNRAYSLLEPPPDAGLPSWESMHGEKVERPANCNISTHALAAHLAMHMRLMPKFNDTTGRASLFHPATSFMSAGEDEEGAAGAPPGSDDGEGEDGLAGGSDGGNGGSATGAAGGGSRTRASTMTGKSSVGRQGSISQPRPGSLPRQRLVARESLAVAVQRHGLAAGAAPSQSLAAPPRQTLARANVASSVAGAASAFDAGVGKAAKGRHPPVQKREPKLRDLDPHITLGAQSPTQRLHCNWPDGLRRQMARHFYGMTPGQILDEEEKERQRDSKTRGSTRESDGVAASDSGGGGGDPELPSQSSVGSRLDPFLKGSPERLAYERRIARSTAGTSKVTYGLEVRIKNTGRTSRCVVERHMERAKGPEEAAGRPTVLLDKLSAFPKRLGHKY